MPLMIANRELYYNGRTRHTGELFEVRDNHVKIIGLAGKASLAPPDMKPVADPPRPPRRRGMMPPDPAPVIEPPPADPDAAGAPPAEDPAPVTAGRYARRDMRPVDEAE